MSIKFRPLHADEVEVRVAQIGQYSTQLLLYKDARCDMNILDETVGAENWQRHHFRDNANCIVSIWDKTKGMWISKEDTGTESYTEKEKGLASDSFKRACVNWGIGRELYTAGRISVKNSEIEFTERHGKQTVKDTFFVSEMEVTNGVITYLSIKTGKGKQVFESGERKPKFYCYDCEQEITETVIDGNPYSALAMGKATVDTVDSDPSEPTPANENPAEQAPRYYCEKCKAEFMPTAKRTAEQLAKASKEKFGKALCKKCANEQISRWEIEKINRQDSLAAECAHEDAGDRI